MAHELPQPGEAALPVRYSWLYLRARFRCVSHGVSDGPGEVLTDTGPVPAPRRTRRPPRPRPGRPAAGPAVLYRNGAGALPQSDPDLCLRSIRHRFGISSDLPVESGVYLHVLPGQLGGPHSAPLAFPGEDQAPPAPPNAV